MPLLLFLPTEILFEPETQFKVVNVKDDTNVSGVTRVYVEVMDTPPVLEKVVNNFIRMCEKNVVKENKKSAIPMGSMRFKENIKGINLSLFLNERPFQLDCPCTVFDALKEAKLRDLPDVNIIRKFEARYPHLKSKIIALFAYTCENGTGNCDSLYTKVNTVLATRNDNDLFNLKKYILHLLSALRKLPSYTKTKTLYRSVKNISERARTPGEILKWPAFTSTSSNEKRAYKFIRNFKMTDAKYILEITGCFRNAHNISEFSRYPKEKG